MAAISPVFTAQSPASVVKSQMGSAYTAPLSMTVVDSLLERLTKVGLPGQGLTKVVTEPEIVEILQAVMALFASQPMFLDLDAPVNICGDIHGQFPDLIRIFNKCGWPSTHNYLFLGDYIDRGRFNLETILLLFALKLKYPVNMFMLRGNHETTLVNRIYGFYEEVSRRYQGSPRLYNLFQDVFDQMPLAARVADRLLCMHGGLSPELLNAASLGVLREIVRPLPDPPNPSLPLDLLWADPDVKVKLFKFSIRGVSCTFGPDVVKSVCQKFDLDLIVVQDGYEFFADRKLVTIFSAPHYCGQFDNAAAVMVVNDSLACSFKILRPVFPNAVVKQAMKQTDITTYQKL